MKHKHRQNSKQTVVKIQPFKEQLPKLHNYNKNSSSLSHAITNYHVSAKTTNDHNKFHKADSLYDNNALNLVKVVDNIQSLINCLINAKINPQQQNALISSLKNYLPLLKDHSNPRQQPSSNMRLKKSSLFSKLSFSMINEKTSQSMMYCSQLKNINTQKYPSKSTLATINQSHKDRSNLSMGITVNNSNIPAQSMIHKQRYKPTYLKTTQVTVEIKNQQCSLLAQTLLKTQMQAQTAESKQATYPLVDIPKEENNQYQQQQRMLNLSQSLRSNKINSLQADIQQQQLHQRAITQMQEMLEAELINDVENQTRGNCVIVGKRVLAQKSEQITSIDCHTQTQNHNSNQQQEKHTIIAIDRPHESLQPQPSLLSTSHTPTATDTQLQAQQILSLRTLLKQRQSEIMNLWMVINSIQTQIH